MYTSYTEHFGIRIRGCGMHTCVCTYARNLALSVTSASDMYRDYGIPANQNTSVVNRPLPAPSLPPPCPHSITTTVPSILLDIRSGGGLRSAVWSLWLYRGHPRRRAIGYRLCSPKWPVLVY